MKFKILFFILLLNVSFIPFAHAGFFGMTMPNQMSGVIDMQNSAVEEIPVRDSAYNLIQKRRQEAQKLIVEGRDLIRKGEKNRNKNLLIKGQLKKEIGEKQLKVLKEQEVERRKENENTNNGW